MTSIAVSGGFDPLHPGHIALLEAAELAADEVYVIVESDAFVSRKHKPLLDEKARLDIVRSLKYVDAAFLAEDPDHGCADILRILKPTYFGVGPEYMWRNDIPEADVCKELGIQPKLLIHPSTYHSSQLLKEACKPQYVNPPVIVSGLICRGQNVLLKKRSEGRKEDSDRFELPGGFLEANENLEQCLFRELREELNIQVRQVEYHVSMHEIYPDDQREIICVYFTCQLDSAYEGPNWWIDKSSEVLENLDNWYSNADRLAVQMHLGGQS